MNRAEFDDCLDQLTRKQKIVLKHFLAGQKDDEIGHALNTTGNNATKHLNNICKAFGFSNGEGEHYRYRDLFLDECIEHIPEQVAPVLKKYCRNVTQLAEYPGRPLAHNSSFYIAPKDVERRYFQELKIPGGLLRIKGSHKRGKTSLLHRLLHKAQSLGYRTVYLNLGIVDDKIIQDLDRFLQWLCASVSRRLGEPPQLLSWDSETFGSVQSCSDYLRDHILGSNFPPLVLAFDEVDRLFAYPVIASEFFALVRGWYEQRNIEPEVWSSLRQIIAYATDVYIKFNINKSPFNVGNPHELSLFSAAQIEALSQQYGVSLLSPDVAGLQHWTGGHPYLVQLALYYCQAEDVCLGHLLNSVSELFRIYKSHLAHLEDNIQSQPEVLPAFQAILLGEHKAPFSQSVLFKLEGLGLIGSNQQTPMVSCQLYQQFFQSRLT